MHKLLHDNRPKTYLGGIECYYIMSLAEKWAQDTYSTQPDSRNHDDTSMFPVNMYCVLSVNASVARAASVGYCLKIEPKLCNTFCVVQRLSGFT